MSNRIYAKKGTMTTRFTEMVWKHMGKNKNGWEPITKAEFDGEKASSLSKSPPEGVQTEAKYRKLYEQGKGFEADSKLVEAKDRYEKAYKIKPNTNLKGKINKLTKEIDAQSAENGRAELVAFGDKARADKDLPGALEAYQSAQESQVTEDVATKIKEVETALEELRDNLSD